MNELAALTKISELIEPMTLDGQRRAMAYLNDKYGNGSSPKEKKKFTLLEDLDLAPQGRKSARSVAKCYELRRENKQIKCLIAVYYFSDYLPKPGYATKANLKNATPVTVDHVATFFHEVEWELPTNLSNTISQASRSEWIDSSSMTDLKTTEKGRMLLHEVWAPIYTETFKTRTIMAEPHQSLRP